jgi:hypothetical protein
MRRHREALSDHSAATSPKAPWPCSTDPTSRLRSGAAGADGVIVHPTEDPAAGQSYTTGRDATASDPRSRSAISSRGKGRLHRRGPVGTPVRVPRHAAGPPVTSGRGLTVDGDGGPATPSLVSEATHGVTRSLVSRPVTGPPATRIFDHGHGDGGALRGDCSGGCRDPDVAAGEFGEDVEGSAAVFGRGR